MLNPIAILRKMNLGRFVWLHLGAVCLHEERDTEDGGFTGVVEADDDDL